MGLFHGKGSVGNNINAVVAALRTNHSRALVTRKQDRQLEKRRGRGTQAKRSHDKINGEFSEGPLPKTRLHHYKREGKRTGEGGGD